MELILFMIFWIGIGLAWMQRTDPVKWTWHFIVFLPAILVAIPFVLAKERR